jgi:hypothetical protein
VIYRIIDEKVLYYCDQFAFDDFEGLFFQILNVNADAKLTQAMYGTSKYAAVLFMG